LAGTARAEQDESADEALSEGTLAAALTFDETIRRRGVFGSVGDDLLRAAINVATKKK
jgi:hypothetical protein